MYPSQKKHLLDLWVEYWTQAAYQKFDLFLARAFKKRPFMGKRDRAWYSEQLFTALRFGLLALDLKVSDEVFKDASLLAFKAAKVDESFFDKVEEISKNSQNQSEDTSENFSWHPDWISFFEKAGLDFNRLSKLNTRAPLWLRAKSLVDLENIKKDILQRNIEFIVDGLALKISGNPKLHEWTSFKMGSFEIQDWASQQIPLLAPLKKDALVWDACAGGGGKTLQLSAILENTGTVIASDVRAFKFDEIKARALKARAQNISCVAWDGRPQMPNFPRAVSDRGGFDLVLVDAPCSSSGTVRRNPEIKWQSPHLKLRTLSQTQLHILEAVEKSVKKGAHLLYGTCSFLNDENEEIVKKFSDKMGSRWKFLEFKKLGYSKDNDSDLMFAALFQKLTD